MQADIEHREPLPRSSLAETLTLALAARIEAGELTVTLPNGGERCFQGNTPGPEARVSVHDPQVFRRLLLRGTLAFGEAYMAGDCDSPDLVALVELAIRNDSVLMNSLDARPWARLLPRLGRLLRPNSKPGARRNIAWHYDLGNDFYRLWLDPSMSYSAAIFGRTGESLEAAQDRKYRQMAKLAGIGPNDRVLEIGCGWGGFCSWAAREVGCHVTAVTISGDQYRYAAERIQTEGLSDRVDLRLQDYRDVAGEFDKIVSIEMLEAVGESYWPRYFETLRERLVHGGRAALQVITIDDDHFESYRRDVDFIQHYIFPGGMLPSPGRLRGQVTRAGLAWHGASPIGMHYAHTLELWRRAFETAWPEIAELGFDERFRRMWRYYLAYCEAGFRTGRIDVLQAALSKT
ncbi:MAG: cyclopropane-fatty-acyl-phospholipid synthase family protein [Pseudomonadota bacterium]